MSRGFYQHLIWGFLSARETGTRGLRRGTSEGGNGRRMALSAGLMKPRRVAPPPLPGAKCMNASDASHGWNIFFSFSLALQSERHEERAGGRGPASSWSCWRRATRSACGYWSALAEEPDCLSATCARWSSESLVLGMCCGGARILGGLVLVLMPVVPGRWRYQDRIRGLGDW